MKIDILPEDADGSRPVAGEPVFQISDLLRILRMRWKLIAGTAVSVIVVTAIVVYNLTPLYSASAVVMLDQRKNNIVDVNAVLAGLPTDPTSLENQVQILRSRSLAARVIDKLHLERDASLNAGTGSLVGDFRAWLARQRWADGLPWVGGASVPTLRGAETAETRRDQLIDGLLSQYTVTAQGHSSAIMIAAVSADPGKAATISNAIADAYVEDQLNAKFEATQKTTQWLADRLQELAAQVRIADTAVQQYKADNNITETASGGSVIEQQVAELSGQLVVARSALAEQEAKAARIGELARSGRTSDVASVVSAVDSAVIGQLRTQEADLLRQEADFSSRYGPRHPKMVELESELRDLRGRIAAEADRIVKNSDNDAAIARAHVKSLEASLAQLEAQSTNENRARVRLSALEAAATSSRSLYQTFSARFSQTQGQEGIETPDAREISRAETPTSASFPDKTRIFEIALPGGLILGFLFALLVERLDTGFRTAAQVEGLLCLPVLSTIPEVAGAGRSGTSIVDRVVDKPMSSFAESLRGLQMGLALSNVDKKPKVVLVTSALPGEGKTTVAIGLARLAAHSGQRVVIIDADLRRPMVADTLDMKKAPNDLIDLLMGSANLTSVLINDPRSDAFVITARKMTVNAPDLLSSNAMETLVTKLRETCDLVIIDSAPLLPVNDTKVLTRLADAIVFALRWEKTPRAAIVSAIRALSDVKASVAGIVLTRAETNRFRYYSYGYQNYYAYNKYYGD